MTPRPSPEKLPPGPSTDVTAAGRVVAPLFHVTGVELAFCCRKSLYIMDLSDVIPSITNDLRQGE